VDGRQNPPVMKILDAQDKELMAVRKFAREGNDLKTILFILSLLFRKG
jgi:hypothetical protein